MGWWRRYPALATLAGCTLFAVGAAFHFAVPVVAPTVPPQFGNAGLFRPWAGWTSTYMALHPFGFGVVFAATYLILRSRNGVSRGWRGGLEYGAVVFLVGSLPVYLLVFASFEVSHEVVACWVVQSVCQHTAAGVAIGLAARHAVPLYGPANLNKNGDPDPRS